MRAVWLKTRCLMMAAHSDVREKGSATGIQQSSQGALVATTRATRVTGTRADGIAFSIEQDAANNILLAMAAC
ncbi:ABC transporter ATP-binding protein [Escherichia coli]|uniref:ABC transporter ATP-binding protein n=1 Tax=Escherichia coli TaxID=562 RepID=A0A376SBN8_ECOLX|nr:ABC transporter ATP-binding protein [Escherichia coli]